MDFLVDLRCTIIGKLDRRSRGETADSMTLESLRIRGIPWNPWNPLESVESLRISGIS